MTRSMQEIIQEAYNEVPQIKPEEAGHEFRTSYLKYEFFFEKLEEGEKNE